MRRMISWILCLALTAGIPMSCSLTAYGAGEARAQWNAEEQGGKVVLTLSVSGTKLNTLQFAVYYDESRLTAVKAEGSGRAQNAQEMSRFLAPEYNRGKGWLAGTETGTLEDGVVEYTLYAAEGSKNRPDGSDGDGYVDMGNGTEIVSLYFEKKEGATLYADSIRGASTRGCPTGIALSTKDENNPTTPIAVTEAWRMSIDLTAVAEPGKTPGSGGTGGGTGSGTSGSAGGGTGSGTSGGTGGSDRNDQAEGGQTPNGGLKPGGQEQNGSQGQNGDRPPALRDIEGSWAKSSIEALVRQGLLSGYADGTFRPEASLNRAEFATVMAKARKLDTAGGAAVAAVFADSKNHWAAGAIGACYAAGYVSGTGPSAFSPDAPITREELVTILCKAAGLSAADDQPDFTDETDISDWARGYVSAAVAAGLVSGYPDGSFRPQGAVSREEMAYLVNAMLQ